MAGGVSHYQPNQRSALVMNQIIAFLEDLYARLFDPYCRHDGFTRELKAAIYTLKRAQDAGDYEYD
jgi:hypothetical protein